MHGCGFIVASRRKSETRLMVARAPQNQSFTAAEKKENLPRRSKLSTVYARGCTHAFYFVGAARTGLTNLHQIALTAPRQFRGCKWATRESRKRCALARNCFGNRKMPLQGKLQLGAFIFNITNVEWKLLGRVLLRNMLLAKR